MTDQLEALRDSIVSAVQHELTRHGHQVASEVKRLQEELAAERAARTQLDGQVSALATAIRGFQQSNEDFRSELQTALEERLREYGDATKRRHDEMDTRIGRVVQEANVGIAAAVEAAARPIMKQLEHRQDKVEGSIVTLDQNLRKFDDQAARMVTHFNNVTTEIDGRMEELSRRVSSNLDERLAALVGRVDEVAAVAARQETEVGSLITSRIDQTEDRINDRIMSTEARLSDEIGTRVAEIDAYVGRVGAGLDDTVTMLNDRISAADAKFGAIEEQLDDVLKSVQSVDAEAIEEMKEKVSSAAGEAVLVRIELERFQKSIAEQMDKAAVRMTELESTVQEQHMDVEAAVQLERLEEIERAVIALDPDQFVRKTELDSRSVPDDAGAAPAFDQPSTPAAADHAGPNAAAPFAIPDVPVASTAPGEASGGAAPSQLAPPPQTSASSLPTT